jgi:alpha-galactosidase
MLEIGNGGLNEQQERTHFAFWAAMKSPLLIGTNLNLIKQSSLAILKSRTLINFNQDPVYGKPANPFKWDGVFNKAKPPQYWSGRFSDGVLVLLFNNAPQTGSMSFSYHESPDLSKDKPYQAVDAWTGKGYGCFSTGLTVSNIRGYDTAVLVLREGCAKGPPSRSEPGKINIDYQ